MRTAIIIGTAALTSIASINAVSAVSNHYVRGYTARNGTLSSLTSKRTPNATKFDNWPTRGNIDLYTGKAGTKSPF